ncbi:MAG: hypothetical protein FWB88_10000 [Defluviitaleaceae bacterium]|nr:hypothetical protein [Defluviitaleaceae bacterium]MCL2239830.1 hypothetical protein [Defluviitaleaceae bacterium]
MTRNQTLNMLYDYVVKKTGFPALARAYTVKDVEELREIVQRSGFARRDCGAYRHLAEPAFPPEEIKGLLGEYMDAANRPDMPFREFLRYKGINADKGTRVEPKPMPQRAWHAAQHSAAHTKKTPPTLVIVAGIVVAVVVVLIVLGILWLTGTWNASSVIQLYQVGQPLRVVFL